MRPWVKLLLSAFLVTGASAWTYQHVLKKAPSRLEFPSTQDTASGRDMLAAIEASLGQIERTNTYLPTIMSKGPTPSVLSNPVEKPAEEVKPEAVEQAFVDLSTYGDKIPVPATKPNATVEAEVTCTDCESGTRVKDMRYMQCSSRNNYLENQLKDLSSSSKLMGDLIKGGPKADTIIKPVCIKSGMEAKFGERNKSFRRCDPGDKQGRKNALRPCISENYFSLISNSFDLVARCMGPSLSSDPTEQKNDILAMFSMMTLESGLHANAVSPTGAAGSGQFTEGAIQSVNRNQISKVRSALERQGGDCARISKEILAGDPPMRSQSSRTCDRVSLERGNPLLSMVYSYASLADSKKDLDESVIEDRRYSKIFADLSHADKSRLKTALTIWSHNTGGAGLRAPLMSLLNKNYRGKKVTNVDEFLKQVSRAMMDFPHKANRKKSRRRETSRYWPAINALENKIEKNAGGGSCFN